MATSILDGYTIVEWPDLACIRRPSWDLHTTSGDLANFDSAAHGAVFVAAVARILAAYCSAPDILLAVQLDAKAPYAIVRASWTEDDSWETVAAKLTSQWTQKSTVTLDSIRHSFDLTDKQHPCPVLVQFAPSTVLPEFPILFNIDAAKASITLSAPKALLHPSVSEQLLAQCLFQFGQAKANSQSQIFAQPELPPSMMSIFERLPEDEVARAYPHISQVTFASEWLEQRAKLSPDATAVKWFPELDINDADMPSESISYRDLDQRSNQVARWLVDQGLQPEDRVAVCLKRDLLFHAAFFGILRAGGCYVPIDPELPHERKAYIARDSGARYVLTESELSSTDLFGPAAIYLDDSQATSAVNSHSTSSFNVAKPEGLAYMLYTSGTTGNPKGCLLTHHGLAQAIIALGGTAAQVRMDDLSKGRYLAVASIAFDVHVAETIVPLALGMTLYSAPRAQLLENLPQYVRELRITHLGIVPSLIEATLNASKDEDGEFELRYIASGGEKMSDSILDKWADHHLVKLANFYGPSEVTIGCCGRFTDSSTPRANIGRPLANVSGYVVDSDLKILPRGGVGELLVEGPLVGRGYHGRPDLTQKLFLEFPEKGRWAYRTGDLVRMMPDQTLEILGRIDTQIKVRGVRIESEGISAIVRKGTPPSPEATLDATTVLAKHPSLGNEQLVSFVAWNTVPIAIRKSKRPSLISPPPGLLKSIRDVCQAELASYMRPNHVIPLDFLPLSSNGKIEGKMLTEFFKGIDISQLSALISDEPVGVSSEACDAQELEVFDVLKRYISPKQRPTPDLHIFQAGMRDVDIIRFSADLKTVFGKTITATEIMKRPVLKDIAQLIESTSANVTDDSDLPVPDAKTLEQIYSVHPAEVVEDIYPPFPVQEGVLARSAENTGLYVQHVISKLDPAVEPDRLRECWDIVAETHPIMRTVFHVDQSTWQVVLKDADKTLWSERSSDADSMLAFRERFYERLATDIATEINENFSTIPLYRLNYFTCSGFNVVVLSIHHALYDGGCLDYLTRDVDRAYQDLERVQTADLRDVLAAIAAIDTSKARSYWTQSFQDFTWPPPAFQQVDSTSPKFHRVPFKTSLSTISSIANKKQVTLQAFLAYIFAYLVGSRFYQRDDVSFGVIRSGRMLPLDNIDVAMCPTIGILPMRIKLEDTDTTLAAAHQTIASMTEYEHVPLGKVQSWLRPGADLFEVLFSVAVAAPSDDVMWTHDLYLPPAPDYPFAVEISIDIENDTVSVGSGWLNGHISDDEAISLLNQFEPVALAIGRGEELPSPLSYKSPRTAPAVQAAVAATNGEDTSKVDPVVVEGLHRTITEFLEIPSSLLTNNASFISLGLDSIKAVGLAKRIRTLGYTVTSAEILKAATLSALALVVIKNKQKKRGPLPGYTQLVRTLEKFISKTEVQFSPSDKVKIFPTTALQSGMLSSTVGSNGTLYIHTFPLTLVDNVDGDRLKAAWESTAKVVDMLRTSFHFIPDNGLWVQAVHTVSTLNWSVEEVRDTAALRVAMRTFVDGIKCEDEFAFAKPPIWLRFFKPQRGSCEIVLVMHHALYDGISVERLLTLVQNFYEDRKPSYKLQFTDMLPEFFRQEVEGTAFWKKHLSNLKRTLIPVRTEKPLVPHYILQEDVTVAADALSSLLKKSETTAQCILQAAVAVALADLTRSQDVVFGLVVSGRGGQGSEDIVGPILNTVPSRVLVKHDQSALDLLKNIHAANMESSAWHQASLRSIQKAIKVDRLWDCLLTFQPLVTEVPGGALWSMNAGEEADLHFQYPLHVEVEQTVSGFKISCACLSKYLDGDDIGRVVRRMSEVIQAFVSEPTAPISSGPAPTKQVTLAPAPAPAPSKPIQAHSPPPPSPREPLAPVSAIPQPQTAFSTTIPPALLGALKSFAPDADIGLHTQLPALGIDSISAIQISGKLRRAGVKLSATQILASKTVQELVNQVKVKGADAGSAKAAMSSTQSPEASPEDGYEPLSNEEKDSIAGRFGNDAQHIIHIAPAPSGMRWAIGGWQASNASMFHYLFPFQLPDNVEPQRLHNAWKMLLKRHELLRSTFATAPGGDEPRIVTFSEDLQWDSWAHETCDDAVFYRTLLDIMKTMVQNPLPINVPPIKSVLLTSQKKSVLLVHIHHFQYDGWCMPITMGDLVSIYNIEEPKANNNLRAFTSLFNRNESRLGLQRNFWQKTLGTSFKPVLLPSITHEARTPVEPTGQALQILVPAALTDTSSYEAKARKLGTTVQNILLAAWAQVQAYRSKRAEATFGVWQVARSNHIENIDILAVPCVSVLPIHVKLSESLVDVAKGIQDNLRLRLSEPVIEHSDLVNIAKWSGMPKGTAIFNVNVNIVRVSGPPATSGFLEPLKLAHVVPKNTTPTVTPTFDKLAVTPLCQNDVVVDIFVIDDSHSMVMCIETFDHIMSAEQAKEMIRDWASLVSNTMARA